MNPVQYIADQFPVKSRLGNLLIGGTYLAVFNPWASAGSRMLEDIESFGQWAPYYPNMVEAMHYSLYGLSGLMLPVMLSKLIYPGGGSKQLKKEVRLGDMTFEERDLFTNVMITGQIGSGKTSSAIYPILTQLLRIYSVEDAATSVSDPYQKLGGLVMDVKGDFYEALILKLHEAGRNVLEDLVVITPQSNYPYIELEDMDTGHLFYVSARGGGDEKSNELSYLLAGQKMPDPATGLPHPRTPLDPSSLLDDMVMDAPIGPLVAKTFRQYICDITFDVSDRSLRFLGWREEGGRLRRILRTVKCDPEIVEYAVDATNRPIYANKPKRLKFKQVRYINNGLTFNICPPSLSPTEMASRLVSMSKTASGKGGGSDNPFWDDATKKHVGWVVQMWRTVNPKVEITAIDINRMTANQDSIDTEVAKLKAYIKAKDDRCKASKDAAEIQMIKDELPILDDMRNYFEGEWATLDMKTKSNLIACITNLFGQFMSEPKLRSTFCVPSSFSMESVMQDGKIFTLVAPGYEGAAKVFGTSLKMEFQALLRRRTAQSNYNKDRFILFMCDEAQNYVIAGGADNTGDENFMALSRQSRVANIIATQSDDSIVNVIGEKSAPVYFQSFGCRIWYQNSNEKTNKAASFVLGKVKKEKRNKQGQEFQTATVLSKDGFAKGYQETVSMEKDDRYPPEIFSSLNVHEGIMYNKGKKGFRDKACRNQLPPDWIGSKDGIAKRNSTVRWYFQAYIENRMHNIGQSALVDHIKPGRAGAASATTGATVSAPGATPPAGAPHGTHSAPTAATPAPSSPLPREVEELNFDPGSDTPAAPPATPPTPPATAPATASAPKATPAVASVAAPAPTEASNVTSSPATGSIDDLLGMETVQGEMGGRPKQSAPQATAPVIDKKIKEDVEKDDEIDRLREFLPTIRERFGTSNQIGNKLQSFVRIIENISTHGVDYEGNLDTPATGAGMTGPKGLYNPGGEEAVAPNTEKEALPVAPAQEPKPTPAREPKPTPAPEPRVDPTPPKEMMSVEDLLGNQTVPTEKQPETPKAGMEIEDLNALFGSMPVQPGAPQTNNQVVETEGDAEDDLDSLKS